MFNHNNNYRFPDLATIEINGKRHYETPQGVFPSVTTVLYQKEKDGIKRWKERIGEEKATEIKNQSTRRGNAIHSVCEAYLKNENINLVGMIPNIKALFLSIKPFLDTLTLIYAQEMCLYSAELGIAGRVDLIARDAENRLFVGDFKGSNRAKTLKQIDDYCMQTAAYSALWEGLTGMPVNDAYIIVAVEETYKSQIFHIDPNKYLPKLKLLIQEFNGINKIQT